LNRKTIGFALAAFVMCLLVAGCAPNSASPVQSPPAGGGNADSAPKVGDPAPGFSLQTVDGQTVSSASLANERKPYVLFFFATW